MSNHNSKIIHWSKTLSEQSESKGFTLIEMLVVAPIVIIMIGIFISAIMAMTGDVMADRASNALSYNIQDSLDRIDSDVKLSGTFLATNDITITSPQGYNNDNTNFHNANSDPEIGQILILKTYATTSNPMTSTQSIMYLSGQPNACSSSIVNQNTPLMLNTIYFVKNNTLWRRVVAPSYYATVGCVGASIGEPWQQPSCAIGIAGTMCKTQDQRLIDNMQTSGFCINYYTTPSTASSGSNVCPDPLANSTAKDGSQSDTARQAALSESSTVSVTINGTNTVAGRDISQTATIREISPNNVTPTPSIVTNGLVVNLDAGNTASYPGTGTTWTDLSGNGINGTLQNGVGYNSSNGGILTLDGSDDFISLSARNWYNPNGFTYSVWVLNNDFSGSYERIMDFGNGTPSNNILIYRAGTGVGTVGFQTCSGSTCSGPSSDNVLSAGAWIYFTATVDGSGNLKMYKNGTQIGSTYSGGNTIANATLSNNYIGKSNWAADATWDGKFGNIQIYSQALSATEIQQNFNVLRVRYGI